ncbi:MAG: ribosomal protein S18-alanine N-acetyltransferase [Bradymonadia bacterium]|jgi:ribosomal-protein-alanine N-acetyltransferase
MGAADVTTAALLSAQEGAARWDAQAFLRELELPYADLYVVEDAGEVAAFAVWWRLVDETHLLNMVVAPQARRRGLGARLVQTMLDQARARRDRVALLEVRAGNVAALRLYGGKGFVSVGRRRGYYSDGEDAVLMECVL